MATGICNDVLGIGLSWDLGVKRREEFGRRISSLQCQRRRSVPSAVSRVVKDSLSFGSSALHVQDVRSGKQTGVVSRSPHICFSWLRCGISEQELCISWLQRRMLVVV
ncbi:hypothetical protein TNCV_2017561 [Trichonephila clavipes]|nr:hypothetical protein TNCV_2017561 [Trichonephila clavipes]